MMGMIEGFARNLSEGNLLVAGIVGIVLIIFLFPRIYEQITVIKERKNNDLKGALEIEALSDDVRFVITESLNRTYFYLATGIASDHYIRSKIRQFLETTKGEITLFGIKRVREYIQIEDGKLVIKFSRYDRFNYYWQIITSIVLVLYCLFGYAVLAVKWDEEGNGKVALAVLSTLGILLTVYSIWKASNFYIARKIIKPAFERFENASSERVSESDQN
ncbi:hypothetical protein [uncultured Amphritea sp.]|uniref:hypothetical protein n=1 Tax=uncultured Amphritea sp. TaxID=981605 RepID=UPI0025F7DCAA|nr:hypothetical protein [uncultured Amphritea sp.]